MYSYCRLLADGAAAHQTGRTAALLFRRGHWPAGSEASSSLSSHPAPPSSTVRSSVPIAPLLRSFMRSPPFRSPSPNSIVISRLGNIPTTPSALIRPSATSPPSSSSLHPHPKQSSPSVTNLLDEFTGLM